MSLLPLALEHHMSLSALKSLTALIAVTLLTACGGGSGSSAPPPVGGLTLEAGEGGVTLSWTAVPGVDYWAYTGQSSSICKNCGNSANNWNSLPDAQSRGWASAMSTPYFFAGLTNDVVYSFIMDGRVNGGPGGDATPSASSTPRLAGPNWYTGSPIASGITGLAFGPILNTSTNVYATAGTYVALGSGGVKYQSANGTTWSAISHSDTTDWKGVVYGFPGTIYQRFVGVGANGVAAYSGDLTNWTTATSAATAAGNRTLNAIATNSGLLVAVGQNGTIIKSSNGTDWTAATPPNTTTHLNAVKYMPLQAASTSTPVGLWVAVGSGGAVWTSASTDASVWTEVSNSQTTQDLKGLAAIDNYVYVNGALTIGLSHSVVAIGNNGTVIQSSDGANWALRSLSTSPHLNAIVGSAGLLPTNQFMIVGDGGAAFTSPDGVNWTPRTTTSSQKLTGLIRGYNNQYLAWAANGTTTYSK